MNVGTIVAALVAFLVAYVYAPNFRPVTEDTVWCYWHSPFPPKIVRRCILNWKTIGECRDVRVLNALTVHRYVPLMEMMKFTRITRNEANRADLIRFYLLERYGGIWIDGSVFMNAPLRDWLPDGFFCFNARRFSKGDVVTLENFFIKSPRAHPFLRKWRAQTEHDFADANYKQNNARFRAIIGKNGDYLVPYVSSMKIPKKGITYEASEDGPYLDTVTTGWRDANKICANISYSTKLVKLFSAPRKACDPNIVPITKKTHDYTPNGVYARFKDRFEDVEGSGDGPVDMVYVICMPSRKNYAKRVVGRLGAKFRVLNAITPKELTPSDYQALSETLNPRNKMLYKKMTKLPVCLSFFMCYYDAYTRGYETIAVFEDDIKYEVSIDRIKRTIAEFNKTSCEICFLGYCWSNCKRIREEATMITENLYEAPRSVQLLCNHALVIKKSFLERYMSRKNAVYWNNRNDHTLSDYLRDNGVKKCIPPKAFVNQNREQMGSFNENYDTGGKACTLSNV